MRSHFLPLSVAACTLVLGASHAAAGTVEPGFGSHRVGTVFGTPAGHLPGDPVFQNEHLNAFVVPFSTGAFNHVEVMPPTSCYGDGAHLWLENINLVLALRGDATRRVQFAYLDQGGFENLQVNEAALYVGELSAAPAAIAPGVTLAVTRTSSPCGARGTVTLTGAIERIVIGGQEFFLDGLTIDTTDRLRADDDAHDVDAMPAGLLPRVETRAPRAARTTNDRDGAVGFVDLLATLTVWGPCP